jgi:hypothetical protein
MKRTLLFVAVVALCAGFIATPNAIAGRGPAAVALSITVEGGPNDSYLPYNIRSDGQGPYVNGQSGVAATFESDGNLNVRSFGARSLTFEYDQPIAGVFPGDSTFNADPALGVAPAEAPYPAFKIVAAGCIMPTIRSDINTPLQTMAVGSQQWLRININYNTSSSTMYKNLFQRTENGGLPAATDGTAWGIITRIDANTWTLEPSSTYGSNVVLDASGFPQQNGAARLLKFVSGAHNTTTSTNLGLFNLPFKMTLTRQ